MKELRERLRTASLADREKALRDACLKLATCDPCTRSGIEEAAATDGERARLRALGQQLGKPYDEREKFVDHARAKLAEGKYGIVGSDGATLLVNQWLGSYCEASRVTEALGDSLIQARKLGFKRVRCQGNNYRRGTVETVEFAL